MHVTFIIVAKYRTVTEAGLVERRVNTKTFEWDSVEMTSQIEEGGKSITAVHYSDLTCIKQHVSA